MERNQHCVFASWFARWRPAVLASRDAEYGRCSARLAGRFPANVALSGSPARQLRGASATSRMAAGRYRSAPKWHHRAGVVGKESNEGAATILEEEKSKALAAEGHQVTRRWMRGEASHGQRKVCQGAPQRASPAVYAQVGRTGEVVKRAKKAVKSARKTGERAARRLKRRIPRNGSQHGWNCRKRRAPSQIVISGLSGTTAAPRTAQCNLERKGQHQPAIPT
jgi:hypothetical protein